MYSLFCESYVTDVAFREVLFILQSADQKYNGGTSGLEHHCLRHLSIIVAAAINSSS